MAFPTISGLMMCGLVAIAVPMQLANIARFPLAMRLSIFVLLATAMVIPLDGLMIVGYVWGLIGDPSIATIALMSLVCIKQLTRRDVCDDRNVSALLYLVLAGGGLLYPLALGLSPYDPYALGFGSWMLYSVLLVVALAAWWMRLHLVVWWIVASALAYSLALFESTNLWNYLLDPIAVLIAIGWTAVMLFQWLRGAKTQTREDPRMKPLQTQKINAVEIAGYAFVLIVIAIGLILSRSDGDSFQKFIEEDGFIEWMTVLGFLAGGLLCLRRVVRLWRARSWGFLILTGLLGLAFIFIAGEEISWGQRLFNVDTPQWMEERNAQKEMNLHNLRFGEVKINKLVFSKIAAGIMLVYFAVLMPFYGKPGMARWIDALAIPIPKLHHTLACVIMLVLTQVLITAPRRGELAEFGGAILFTLIVAFPSNFAAFDPRRSTRQQEPSEPG